MIAYFAKNLSSTNINDRKGGIKALTSIGIALKDHVKINTKLDLSSWLLLGKICKKRSKAANETINRSNEG